jgi:ubiquinone/menaquinone biosynthesis C-methylase UbiE
MRRTRWWRWTLPAAGSLAAWWWFGDKAPYPYEQRRLLDVPLPGLSPRRVIAELGLGGGERVLELGPGTGLQSVPVAVALGEAGRLDIVDVQPEMLEHVMTRLARSGAPAAPVVPACADARQLPFATGVFDAAYAVTVLGETGDPGAVLGELARVVAIGGRLVVGEFFDPHWMPAPRLRVLAEAAGWRLARRRGPGVAYLARFDRVVSRAPTRALHGR